MPPPRRKRKQTRKGYKVPAGKTLIDRKQSAAINKLLKQQYRLSQYSYQGEGDGTYQSYPLINPAVWNPIFQSNFRANNTDRCFIQNVHLLTNITVGISGTVSYNPFHYCLFVVSLRKEARLQTLQRLSPLLTNPVENLDYTYSPIGATVGNAQWRLNPAIYQIHAIRRGMVGNVSVEALAADAPQVTNIEDANKNHRIVVPWKRRIKRVTGLDVNGNPLEWKDMTVNDVNPADQLYMLFFNNAEADQEVAFAWSMQANTKVPQ